MEEKRRMADDRVLGLTENTLFKVYDELQEAGLSPERARECIDQMQNRGIFFREMIPREHARSALGEIQSALRETQKGLRSNTQGLGPVAQNLIDPLPTNQIVEK